MSLERLVLLECLMLTWASFKKKKIEVEKWKFVRSGAHLNTQLAKEIQLLMFPLECIETYKKETRNSKNIS